MLVLARCENERICIGSDITVTVISVRGKMVRIGIEAPPDVMVLREELLERDNETVRDAEGVREALLGDDG